LQRRSPRLAGPLQPLTRAAARHPVAAVLLVALVARVFVAVLSSAVTRGVLIPDESQYIDLARTVAEGGTADEWAPAYGQTLYDATAVFTGPLVWLFQVFGPSRLVGELYSAVVGATVAGLTVAIGRRFLQLRFAVIAGLVVALMPSQVLFSSVVLREAHVWLGLALIALGVVVMAGSGWQRIAGGLALAVAGLFMLDYLREQTMFVAAWAFLAAVLLTTGRRWLPRAGAALAVVALVPLVAGFGVGGLKVSSKYGSHLEETRAKLAVGAHSAIVKATAPTPSNGTSSSYTQPAPDTEEPVSSNISRLPQGLLDVTVRPYPWEATTGIALLLARLENILWYALYALAAVGAVVALRRRSARLALQFPVLVTGLIVGVGAVTQGNLGTAFRHRDQILWAVALGAAGGLQWLVTESRFARPRASEEAEPAPVVGAPPRAQEPLGVG
jgi:hypothetical protein